MASERVWSKVMRRMWNSADFRALSAPPPSGQFLWLRLLTGPELSNIPGLIPAGEMALAEALGWTLEGFREAFAEVSDKGMARADWNARLVWVPRAPRHNAPESPNVVRSWRTHWDLAPDCRLKGEAWSELRDFTKGLGEGFAKAFIEACPRPSLHPSPNQEQEQEQDQEQDVSRARAREVHPTEVLGDESDATPFGLVERRFSEWRARRGKGRWRRGMADYSKIEIAVEVLSECAASDGVTLGDAIDRSLRGFETDGGARAKGYPAGWWLQDTGRFYAEGKGRLATPSIVLPEHSLEDL